MVYGLLVYLEINSLESGVIIKFHWDSIEKTIEIPLEFQRIPGNSMQNFREFQK
jgi:hypothetical protein